MIEKPGAKETGADAFPHTSGYGKADRYHRQTHREGEPDEADFLERKRT